MSHQKAAQIKANPKDAENYIASLVEENERLRERLETVEEIKKRLDEYIDARIKIALTS